MSTDITAPTVGRIAHLSGAEPPTREYLQALHIQLGNARVAHAAVQETLDTVLAHHDRISLQHAQMLDLLRDCADVMSRDPARWKRVGEEYDLDTAAPTSLVEAIAAVSIEVAAFIAVVEGRAS